MGARGGKASKWAAARPSSFLRQRMALDNLAAAYVNPRDGSPSRPLLTSQRPYPDSQRGLWVISCQIDEKCACRRRIGQPPQAPPRSLVSKSLPKFVTRRPLARAAAPALGAARALLVPASPASEVP